MAWRRPARPPQLSSLVAVEASAGNSRNASNPAVGTFAGTAAGTWKRVPAAYLTPATRHACLDRRPI
jgi:hypothetical protein